MFASEVSAMPTELPFSAALGLDIVRAAPEITVKSPEIARNISDADAS